MAEIDLRLYISKRFNQNTDGEEDISNLIIDLFNREDKHFTDLVDERGNLVRDKLRLIDELDKSSEAVLEFSRLFEQHHSRADRAETERDALQTALADLLKVISENNLIVGGRAYLDAARKAVLESIVRKPIRYTPSKSDPINYVFATGDSDALNINTKERRYKFCPSCESVSIPMELIIGCPKCKYDDEDDHLVNHCDDCCVALMTHVYQELCRIHEMV